MKLFNKIFIILIIIYQKCFSPFFPSSCRFNPSCSEYSRQAFHKYSFFKALLLTLKRIIRCNPYCKGGDDPLK